MVDGLLDSEHGLVADVALDDGSAELPPLDVQRTIRLPLRAVHGLGGSEWAPLLASIRVVRQRRAAFTGHYDSRLALPDGEPLGRRCIEAQ
ncbi:MAG: hypothetical protein ACT4PM_03870 [Gemmatimonadales bacterium]